MHKILKGHTPSLISWLRATTSPPEHKALPLPFKEFKIAAKPPRIINKWNIKDMFSSMSKTLFNSRNKNVAHQNHLVNSVSNNYSENIIFSRHKICEKNSFHVVFEKKWIKNSSNSQKIFSLFHYQSSWEVHKCISENETKCT